MSRKIKELIKKRIVMHFLCEKSKYRHPFMLVQAEVTVKKKKYENLFFFYSHMSTLRLVSVTIRKANIRVLFEIFKISKSYKTNNCENKELKYICIYLPES